MVSLLRIISYHIHKVHQQGTLDSVCGVYAIINSIALLDPHVDTDGLFPYLLHKLEHRLCTAIIHGLNNKELRKWVFAPSIAYCAKQRAKLRYVGCKRTSLDEHWQVMQAHCHRHGPGSIVLGIAGTYDHWTCIKEVTERTLMLADSW